MDGWSHSVAEKQHHIPCWYRSHRYMSVRKQSSLTVPIVFLNSVRFLRLDLLRIDLAMVDLG